MSIYKKLHQIQTKIKGLGKDSKSFQYGYVSGAKVLEFVRPLMDEYGLLLKQEIISIDNSRQDYTTVGKRWEEVNGQKQQVEFDKLKSEILSKVMMRFTWIDIETGEKDENEFGANGQNDWEKGLGSALTYAERYFLLKFFHIPTDEDDIDNDLRKKVEDEKIQNTNPQVNPPQNNTTTTPPQNKDLPWLNENDTNWKTIGETVKSGKKVTMAALNKRFKMSQATKELLIKTFKIQ